MPHRKKGVVDLYDVSDDWVPIYDRTDLDGFYVAIGTSGNQYKNGPVAGHVMAELITAVQGGLDHDNDPLVVEGRYTGIPIEVGFFSRNREVAATSMTVHGWHVERTAAGIRHPDANEHPRHLGSAATLRSSVAVVRIVGTHGEVLRRVPLHVRRP